MVATKIKVIGSLLVVSGAAAFIWYSVAAHQRGLPREETRRPVAPRVVSEERPGMIGTGGEDRSGMRSSGGDGSGPGPMQIGGAGGARSEAVGPGGFGNLTAEQREERRQQFAQELGLTEEQMARMQALRQGGGPPDRDEVAKILNPEQLARFEERIRGGRDQMLQSMMDRLSPEDQEALRRRMEERPSRRGEGGGGGRGGSGNPQRRENR